MLICRQIVFVYANLCINIFMIFFGFLVNEDVLSSQRKTEINYKNADINKEDISKKLWQIWNCCDKCVVYGANTCFV